MKKAIALLGMIICLLWIVGFSYGQNITVTSAVGQNPNTLIQNILAGEGVELSAGKFNNSTGNITYPQVGTFSSGASNFPYTSGIVMTTGNVSVAPGPNTGGSSSQGVDPYYTDTQLSAIASGTVRGCSVLDFDFVAYADTFAFNYIFASEEYPEYVCSNFNDVFAFFLTGTDPVTYTTTTKNVAIIPNTVTAATPTGVPVTINSVNNGFPGSSGGSGTGCYYTYSQYYNASPSGVQYDASTTSLTASALILACEPYHMHLAVGNVGDNSYDSGVFLEAGSFYSPSLQISSQFNIPGHGDTLIQNCREANIDFSLPRANATAYSTYFTFGGSAIINQDYSFITEDGTVLSTANNSFTFSNDTLVQVHIAILPDAVFSGGTTKTVDLYLETVFCEFYPDARKYDTIHYVLMANDSIRLTDTSMAYCHSCNHVTGILTSGTDPLNFEWIPATGIQNPHALESEATITQNTLYKLVASDPYGCLADTANIAITIHDIPDIANTISPAYGCAPLPVSLLVNHPSDDYDYLWITSQDTLFTDTAYTSGHQLSLVAPGYYNVYLWASSAIGCNDSVLIQNAVHVSDYPHAAFTYAPDEPQNGKEVLFYNASIGDDIVSYHWSFGDGNSSTDVDPVHKYHLPGNDNMVVRLTVTNGDGCADDTTVVIPVTDNFAFWVPNSFTPNNDGNNDIFLPKVKDVAYYRLQLFNRFGQLFFTTTDIEQGWDGTINGKMAPTGVYTWKIDYIRYSNEQQTLIKTGIVNLIR